MARVRFTSSHTDEERYQRELMDEARWFARLDFPVYLPRRQKAGIGSERQVRGGITPSRLRQVERLWRKVEKNFFSVTSRFHNRTIVRTYYCHVSRFGPEGKYRRPNLLFLRFRTKRDERRAVETIAHELLHLMFADFLERRKATYAQREGVIDSLFLTPGLRRIFPEYQVQVVGKSRVSILREIAR